MNILINRRTSTVAILFSRWHFHLRKCSFSQITVSFSEAFRKTVSKEHPVCNFEIGYRIKSLKLQTRAEISRFLSTSRNRCWQCNGVVTERDLVCLSCGCVQEPRDHLNHFELFKENPHFDVDTKILTIKFRRLQNLLHPDKFATRPEKEQQYSLEQSSRVNRAYQVLSNPLERGLYLLQLNEMPLQEDQIEMSSEFLEDIMEVNENLMSSKTSESVISIRHVNNARLEVLFAELSLTFKEKNIEHAREILAKLKYFVSIDMKIKKMEEEMGISRED